MWVSEGIAQYFEDGIFVRNRLVLGQRHARLIENVARTIHNRTAIYCDLMLNITSEGWRDMLAENPQHGALMYDQAWSMVYSLIGTTKKRQKFFVRYLELLSRHNTA